MLQGVATFCNVCNIVASPPGTASESPLAHAPGVDLPTKIVAEHLATRITDLEVELAEQAASVVVEGLVFVDGVDKLPAAVAGVRTLAPSTAYYLTTEIDLEGDRLVLSDSTVLLGSSSETRAAPGR